jgi:hypothetical protein
MCVSGDRGDLDGSTVARDAKAPRSRQLAPLSLRVAQVRRRAGAFYCLFKSMFLICP